MKKIVLKAILLLLPVCSVAQIKLEKRSLLDNKIQLLVPTYFKPMSESMMDIKYPNRTQQPDLVLTDENAEVNIVISRTPQPLQTAQVGAYKDFMVNSLKKSHPDAQWLDSGLKLIHGKHVGFFKLMSNAVDQKVFVYYFITNMEGKALILTFNCTEKLLPDWKDTAESIVSSLEVK